MANDTAVKNTKKNYKLVPPDAGWAYMIWIAAIINFTTTTMFIPSMGMIFNDFYIEMEMDSVHIQVVNGVNSLFIAVGSFCTGPMTKIMSMRQLSFIGSMLLCGGIFGIAFNNSYPMLIVTQGFFMGTGVGVIYNVTCTTLNNYFAEKLFIMTSLAYTIAASAALVSPLIVHWISLNYGFRGTILFMAAMLMQTLVGSSLQQPVKWHLKKVPISPDIEELLENKNDQKKRNSQAFEAVYMNTGNTEPAKSNRIVVYIKNALDWHFLKQYVKSCACVGTPLSLVSDVMFTLFVPQALYARGWKEREVAWALSLLAFGDIATRIFLTVGSTWLRKLGSNLLFVFGMVLEIAAKLVLLWFPHPTVTYVTLTVIGCSRCMLLVLFSLVISEAAPPENYATAFGATIFIYGTISITLGPAIGAVRDATGDYTVMFYLLIALMAAVTFVWCIEIYRDGKRNKTLHKAL